MGLVLHVPIIEVPTWSALEILLKQLKDKTNDNTLQILLADASDAAILYNKVNLTKSSIIVLGSEAGGLSDDARKICQNWGIMAGKSGAVNGNSGTVGENFSGLGQYIKIPMSNKVESLNAAIAGSIILSEVVRQRESLL